MMNKPMMMPLGGAIPGMPKNPMMGSLMGAMPMAAGGKGGATSMPQQMDLASMLSQMMGRK